MGAKLSNSKTLDGKAFSTHQDSEQLYRNTINNSVPESFQFGCAMGNADFSALDDLLVDILSNLPANDLIFSCRLVCKEWRDIIDGHSVWKIKCETENKITPPINFESLPDHYYRKIYLHNPYGRNLVPNPCGEKGLQQWRLTQNGGDGFMVENPPGGADPVPAEVGVQYCFSTSYGPCMKHKVIDLLSEGINEEVLRLKTTKIQVGEWYAARFDCASEYRLTVVLLDKDYDEMAEATEDNHVIDNFEFEFREEQWIGKEWHQVTHTFENVANVRYVFFQHFGKDCQYWAGNYGSKMTGAFVKLIV